MLKTLFLLLAFTLLILSIKVAKSETFKVDIIELNYNKIQKAKLEEAKKLLALVFNSQELRAKVASRKAFTESQGLSNPLVLERILRGSEQLTPGDDYTMTLKVKMYYRRLTKVVGYTTPESLIVNTNSKFHDSFTPCQVAANLSHEWAHKLGFTHRSAADKDSVPYAIGDLVLEACNRR